MSSELKTSSSLPTAVQQRRQASILLVRLQWLFIIVLILAFVWLYLSQQQFKSQLDDRLQKNEQVVTRLNEMDDRLFAISQQTLPAPRMPMNSQAQNQLSLLRIQVQAANSLLADNNYKATIDLLKGLQWQLAQSSNEIAPALSIIIEQNLSKDIERLQAQSSQPNAWQLQNLAIQNIQTFLQSQELHKDSTLTTSSTSNNKGSNNKQSASRVMVNSPTLTRRQLIIHEVIMTLNLAVQASNMRDQEQLNRHLMQARKQLQTLTGTSAASNNATAITNTTNAPRNSTEVVAWLDELIANVPATETLLTVQVLEQSNKHE